MNPLKLHSYGVEVVRLQNFLNGQKLYDGVADGKFGPVTKAAVVEYQRRRRLVADGIVGNVTLARMISDGFGFMQPVANTYPPKPKFPPLSSNSARMKIWGAFDWIHQPIPGNRENIEVLGDWKEKNLVRVELEQLTKRGFKLDDDRWFHKKVADSVDRLFIAWENEGLLEDILSYDGDYAPRLVRGSSVTLSNHAFGTAFDLNAAWNGLGVNPPPTGKKGSLFRLVKLANDHGFYWGGHFSRLDGMHFEHAGVF